MSNTPAVTLAAVIAVLCACHLHYLVTSRMVPSADEAHYMSGALSIANGVRSGTLSGAAQGYLGALAFKAPLVSVPAALFMLLGGGLTLPAMLSLVATFAALGIAAFLLFRRALPPWPAAAATALLLTMPMTTGLTHRFYTELLLLFLSVWYLAVLARGPWMSIRWSALAGVILGLGLLTKITFAALLALPTAYSLAVAARANRGRRVAGILARAMLAAGLALLVAGPWYARNLDNTLRHAKVAATAEMCYYPHWLLADLSSGPGVWAASVAIAALPLLVRAIARRRLERPAMHVWMLVLLLALATLAAVAATTNKATRFSVTWLPAFALLAAALPVFALRNAAAKHATLAAFAAAGVLLSLHNSFGILPFGPIRAGDLRLLDDRFPLNVPGWYDDNHPLDRRDFRLGEVVPIIAADAAPSLRRNAIVRVRLAEMGLLINHDYLALLSAARREPVDYSWWLDARTPGGLAPDYIVHYRGFRRLYPGIHFFEWYPGLESEIATGKLPYSEMARLDGPEGVSVLVYRRNGSAALSGDR